MNKEVKFVLRTEEETHIKLKRQAKKRGVSMNQAINEILVASLNTRKKDIKAQLKELARML